ncbi:MAG TPA: AIR synthase related protein, partial [Candidatus Cloacimonadota bacterium]|nr:AIR synthase related protein [Candidatus Cloacimonadota bacterium]
QNYALDHLSVPDDYNSILIRLLSCPNIASKHQIYQQYDHMVQIGTVVEPGSDAAVIRIHGTNKAIAAATDCNGRYCYLDPYEGAKAAVAEAARNVACSGAKPLAVTNCLNFGNPYKPEVYYAFAECIRGMGDTCKAFATPVTGGNVSFYNENPDSAIYPTPVIGMLGLMDDFRHATTQYFKNPGDAVILLGSLNASLGGSEYLKQVHNLVAGCPPRIDLDLELRLQELVVSLISHGLVASAHDVSDGGLAVALAESCFNPDGSLGFTGSFATPGSRTEVYFGESGGKVIVSCAEANTFEIRRLAASYEIPAWHLGFVSESGFRINNDIEVDVAILSQAFCNGLVL